MAEIRYVPNRYDSTVHKGESNEELLLDCLKDFGYELEPELNKAFMGKKVVVYVNNENIAPNDWAEYEISYGDVIEITHTIEQGRRAGVIQIVVGIVLIAVGSVLAGTGWGAPAAPYFYMAGISLIIGGILTIFFAPTEPQAPDQDTPVYGWDGPRTIWTAETSVPVVYGKHLVGGSGINFKIENDGSTSYAYMLIALGEGEISGVMDSDDSALVSNPPPVLSKSLGDDLVTNGQFTSDLSSWTVEQYWTWDADNGGQARATNWNDASNAKMYQTISITAGNTYRVRYRIRAVDDHGGRKYGKIRAELGGTNGAWHNVADIPGTAMTVYEDIVAGSSTSTIFMRADDYCNAAIDGVLVKEILPAYIFINDQLMSAYSDVSWAFRAGTNTQSTLEAFRNEVNTNYDYGGATGGRKLSSLFNQHTTTGNINQFTIHLEFPNGLFKLNNDGKEKSRSVNLLVEFKKSGASTWSRLTDTDANGELYSTDANNGDWVKITKKTTAKFLATITVRGLDTDIYNVRIRRQSDESTDVDRSDRVDAVFVTETLYADLAYPNTALLALKMKATNQLSGQLPNVQTLIQGKKIRVPDIQFSGSNFPFEDVYWDNASTQWKKISNDAVCTWDGTSYVTQYSSNPAYCLRDFITDDRYGLGEFITSSELDDDTIDLAAKKQWQLVEGEHRNELHFVIEGPAEPAAVMQQIARVGRMFVFYSNGYIKFKYEEDESSVQLFTMGNVLENSFGLSFTPHTQLPNIMEVQYTDANDKYKMNTLEVVDETEWALGKPRRKKTLSLKGVTNVNQALREAKFTLNKAKYARMIAEWKAPLDAVHCEPGDIVDFQHDIVQWGWGGKAIGGSSTTIQLDQDVPTNVVAAPTSYDIKVQHSDDTIETFDILSVSGYTVTIDGTFSTTPAEDDKYLIGQTGTTIYPFRIMSISITDDEELQIQAVEHEAAVYSDTGLQMDTIEYSELPNPSIIPSNVTDLTLKEMKDKLGFIISFNAPSQTRSDGTDEDTDRAADFAWHRAEIYLSVDNVNFDRIATAYEAVNNIEYTDVVPYGTYYVRVYSASRYVSSSTYEEANIKIRGNLPHGVSRPYPPTGLEIFGQGNNTKFVGKDVKFRWKPRVIYSGVGDIEIHDPAGGVDTWAYISGYKVEIWDDDVLLREEYLSREERTYIYTYEKNKIDSKIKHSGGKFGTKRKGVYPRGTFTIKVYQRNLAGKLSWRPAVLTVSSDTPPKPSNIEAISEEDGVTILWDEANITDFLHYKYRSKVNSGAWSDWNNIYNNKVTRWLDRQEVLNQGRSRSSIYVDARTVDVFGTESGSSSVSASCNNAKFGFTVSPEPGRGHFTTVASALDVLSGTGGVVQLKQGTHSLPTTSLKFSDNDFELVGEGIENTKLVANNTTATTFKILSKAGNYTFKNFTASLTLAATQEHFLACVASSGAGANTSQAHIIFDNVRIRQVEEAAKNSGIYCKTYGAFRFENSEIVNGTRGILVHGNNTTIKNNLFENLSLTNIQFELNTATFVGLTIKNNIFDKFRAYGIHRPGVITSVGEGADISNNSFFLNTATGAQNEMFHPSGCLAIKVGYLKRSNIANNNIIFRNASDISTYSGTIRGFDLYYLDNVNISGNTMLASLDIPGTLRFIYVDDYIYGCSILGNSAFLNNATIDNTWTGIYLGDYVEKNIISDNTLTFTNRSNDTGMYGRSTARWNTGRGNLIASAGTGQTFLGANNDILASEV